MKKYPVLLVEDSPGDASIVRSALASAAPEIDVRVAPDLRTARTALDGDAVECVLLDLSLPDADGLEALTTLSRSDGPSIVVLTGRLDDDLALAAIARGADDYLVKDHASPDTLARTVRYAIERRAARRLLEDREAEFGWAIESLREGVVIHGADGRVIHRNGEAERLLGFAPRPIPELQSSVAPAPYLRPDGTPLPPDEHPSRVAFETRRGVVGALLGVEHADGSRRWLSVNALPVDHPTRDDPEAGAVVTSFEDVTEQRRTLEALEELSLRDPLTGLPNRALVLDRLGQALARAHDPAGVAVVVVDVDGFNSLNDSYGFHAGDELLAQVAVRLQAFHPTSTVGRLSADTFVVVVEDDHDPEALEERIGALLGTCGGRFVLEAAEVHVTCSAGIAVGGPSASPESLVRNADIAVHRAKAGGGGQSVVFEDRDLASVRERLELVRDLRVALEQHSFEVAFQPLVRTGDLACVAAEALLRWHHPTRGPIPPDTVVEVASAIGAVGELTDQVIEQACDQVARWQRAGVVGHDFHLAVNLAAADLTRDLAPRVERVLERTGLDASCLALEVTETSLVGDWSAALESLRAVKRVGVHVALDDFGTGYSSLSYLKQFPIDTIKIDKSFVAGLGSDADATTLVRGIVALARGLGLATVAEGIENDVQLEAVRELSCPLAQGFLWSRPVPAARFPAVLADLASRRAAADSAPTGSPQPAVEVVEEAGWPVLDSLPAPIAVVDAGGTIVATNLSWKAFAIEHGGDAASGGVGANYLAVCRRARGAGADEAALAARGLRAVLAGDRPSFELAYDCSHEAVSRRFLLSVSPLVGRTGMAVVAHLDTTDRHLVELALATSQDRLRRLVDHVPIGVLRLDQAACVVESNPAVCHVLGRPAEDLLGASVSDIFERDADSSSASARSRRSGLPATRSTLRRFRRPDGELRVAQVTDVTIPAAAGEATSFVATVEDITDELRLAEELHRAQEMEALGRLSAGIAHEINTPIQFISDNLTFLADLWPAMQEVLVAASDLAAHPGGSEALSPATEALDLAFCREEVPLALEQSLAGTERVASIVRAMKAFGHPDHEEPEPADLNEVVSNVATITRNETKYVADLVVDLAPLPVVHCFPGAVGQAVLNLLVNSAHALGATASRREGRGHITLATRAEADVVRITVSDDGPGIDDDALPHVFEPFFTTKAPGEGTGQGLALVWATVVERHHGDVRIDTSPLGTAVTLSIPFEPPIAPPCSLAPPALARG